MLTGYVYAQALHAQMLSDAALTGHLIENSNCLNEIQMQKLAALHDPTIHHRCRKRKKKQQTPEVAHAKKSKKQ